GTWDVRSEEGDIERVRPQDISGCGLLTIEGELDDISGSGQTKAALKLCSGIAAGDKHHYEVKGAGHYGIFSGRRWRDLVYPEVLSFIKAHHKVAKKSTTKKIAVTKSAAKSTSKMASSRRKATA
ncbi:MAG: polyhydroxyalkanoate depolymerase, partial [Betaproteobacteria bacterium]|nr:polyhydroxyalkanoate depolymerase [Betaproteobacteria bacterium]